MENKKRLSPEEISESYFEMQAAFGFTKHVGGLKATRELIELCHIDKDKYVLEVGCGVGKTSCYIAENQGSRVVGVDIIEGMIDRSKEKAKRKGVEDRVEFRVADAQDLPFENDLFDAVIGESIIAFPKDKQRAVDECARVTKPGGYVGLNEVTWVKAPPAELVRYFSHITGAKPETSNGWKELLESSGLTEIEARVREISALDQWINEIKGLDIRDWSRAWYRLLSQLIANPAYRRFAREALSVPKNIFGLFKYMGYGIYVGRRTRE